MLLLACSPRVSAMVAIMSSELETWHAQNATQNVTQNWTRISRRARWTHALVTRATRDNTVYELAPEGKEVCPLGSSTVDSSEECSRIRSSFCQSLGGFIIITTPKQPSGCLVQPLPGGTCSVVFNAAPEGEAAKAVWKICRRDHLESELPATDPRPALDSSQISWRKRELYWLLLMLAVLVLLPVAVFIVRWACISGGSQDSFRKSTNSPRRSSGISSPGSSSSMATNSTAPARPGLTRPPDGAAASPHIRRSPAPTGRTVGAMVYRLQLGSQSSSPEAPPAYPRPRVPPLRSQAIGSPRGSSTDARDPMPWPFDPRPRANAGPAATKSGAPVSHTEGSSSRSEEPTARSEIPAVHCGPPGAERAQFFSLEADSHLEYVETWGSQAPTPRIDESRAAASSRGYTTPRSRDGSRGGSLTSPAATPLPSSRGRSRNTGLPSGLAAPLPATSGEGDESSSPTSDSSDGETSDAGSQTER